MGRKGRSTRNKEPVRLAAAPGKPVPAEATASAEEPTAPVGHTLDFRGGDVLAAQRETSEAIWNQVGLVMRGETCEWSLTFDGIDVTRCSYEVLDHVCKPLLSGQPQALYYCDR